MKEETVRRGLSYTGKVEDSEDESNVSDANGSPVTSAVVSPKAQNVEANTQDPDSTIQQLNETYPDTTLVFLKRIRTKGNIKMMTENEVLFIKKILKDKNHEYWSD